MKINESIIMMKSLADSSRLLVINSLIEKPQYVEEIAERLKLAPSTVSFHLKKLENAGLVLKVKEQYYTVYRLNEDVFNLSLRDIISFDNVEKTAQDERIKKYRDKILKIFIRDGKLIRIPSQKKKQLIILEELAGRFDPDKTYTEKEINEIVEDFFYDYVTLRRMLIDEGMMTRTNIEYKLKLDRKNTESISHDRDSNFQKMNKKDDKKMDRNERKEIIKNYKMTKQPMGIFQIRNDVNGKVYITKSMNLNASFNRYKMELQYGGGIETEQVLKDVKKYGIENFSFSILDELKHKENDENVNYKEELDLLEEMWLEKLQPYDDKGYNRRKNKERD